MNWRFGIAAVVLLLGCGPEQPVREQDVIDALVEDFFLPMDGVLVVSWPSDCRTEGETDAVVSAALFAALLAANDEYAEPFDLPARLRVDRSGTSPRMLSARQREPVLGLSRIGIAGNEALACVEVFGVQERAFFLLLERDGSNGWSVRSELEAWHEGDPMPWEREPEELPDGELYGP